jgi:nicotinamidase-related amidase
MVWPVHCEIGSWGHNVHADVRAAYNAWEERQLGSVEKIVKGSNPWTEHYSAVQAEVPDPQDPGTQLNRGLVERLAQADLLLIAGEASSHCVKATTEHIVQNLPAGGAQRVVLLSDCMSPVAGFEAQHASFLADMREAGAQLATSSEMVARLQAGTLR